MDSPAPNYFREFAKSPHHLWFALGTLGLGFLSASPLFLLAGATAYVFGWIYLPDSPFFRRWVDHRFETQAQAAAQAQVAEFIRRRDNLMAGLSPERRERYGALSAVCRSIEAASRDNAVTAAEANADPRLRKLDELMWTFLRLLTIEESLERFLETERREDVPALAETAERETKDLETDMETLKSKGNADALESKQRLLSSRRERLEVLKKRLQRIGQARDNLELVVSEQDRLQQQIKLIRADAVATRNAEALTARIDATVQHLDETNKWLSELDEFKDLVGDLPPTEARLGFETSTPPVLTAEPAIRIKDRRAVRNN